MNKTYKRVDNNAVEKECSRRLAKFNPNVVISINQFNH